MLTTRALDMDTWLDFAALVEANNGVWGGCWCMWYHGKAESEEPPEAKRELKRCRVAEGCAHAALVYEGGACVGWCQYGPPAEIPRIHNQRAYEKDAGAPRDWRITCFFVGKGHRGKGVGRTALRGALDQIARAGGGTVEAFPDATEGRKVSVGFLFNGALPMFKREGFARDRKIGKHKWVVTKTVSSDVKPDQS